MILSEAEFNIGLVTVMPLFFYLVYRFSPLYRNELVSRSVEQLRIERTTGYVALGVILVGLYVPAYLGVAPINSWSVGGYSRLSGILSLAFLIAGVILGVISVSANRTHSRLRRGRETRLESPPSTGLALVAGTAQPSEDGPKSVPGAGEGTLLYDYRLPEESMPRSDGPWSGTDGDLVGSVPFRVTGPSGSVRVDPSGATLGIDEREHEDSRIETGDSVTVFGRIRRTDGDRFAMTGDDILYLTKRTPEEWKTDLARAYYVCAAASVVLLVASVGILLAIAT